MAINDNFNSYSQYSYLLSKSKKMRTIIISLVILLILLSSVKSDAQEQQQQLEDFTEQSTEYLDDTGLLERIASDRKKPIREEALRPNLTFTNSFFPKTREGWFDYKISDGFGSGLKALIWLLLYLLVDITVYFIAVVVLLTILRAILGG